MDKKHRERMKYKVMQMHAEGADVVTIGEALGRAPSTIRDWFELWGVPVRGIGSDVRRRRQAQVLEMHKAGVRPAEIHRRMSGVSYATVKNWVRGKHLCDPLTEEPD